MARPKKYPIKKVLGFDAEMLAALDHYRRQQDEIPNLSDAIRTLLEEALVEKGHLRKVDTSS